MNGSRFMVKVALFLFFAAVGFGSWTALVSFNKKLATPVCALRVEQAGEKDYRVELLGESLDFSLQGGLEAARPLFADARGYFIEKKEKASVFLVEIKRACEKWFELFRG